MVDMAGAAQKLQTRVVLWGRGCAALPRTIQYQASTISGKKKKEDERRIHNIESQNNVVPPFYIHEHKE